MKMKMYENEIERYQALNDLANGCGTVLFGGTEDKAIPLAELKQTFEFDGNLYNRSISGLSIALAAEAFEACAAKLKPSDALLHIGDADLEHFQKEPAWFDNAYRNLISSVKKANPRCIISVISLKNPMGSAVISEMNRHLKSIAEAEQCHFFDINLKRVWNPKEMREIVSFIYSTGFVRPLKRKLPNYDLIKILFCHDWRPMDCGGALACHSI